MDQWGGTVTVRNPNSPAYNPYSDGPDGGGGYGNNNYANGGSASEYYTDDRRTQSYTDKERAQYMNNNGNYQLSTAIRRGHGYEVSEPAPPQPFQRPTSPIVNAYGVGPSRGAVVALANTDPSKVGVGMALTTQENNTYLGLVVGNDGIDSTFWRPSTEKEERGLLEALFLRGKANGKHLLISSRPARELECNFSTPDNRLFNINSDVYKVNRAVRAVRGLRNMKDDGMVNVKEIKDGLADALPRMTSNEYHLVKYRDYSDWATRHYWKEAKKDSLLGRKYVEKCFALRVGADHGALIPITHQQLIKGHELLIHEAVASHEGDIDPQNLPCFALSQVQFDSLNVSMGGDGGDAAENDGYGATGRCTTAGGDRAAYPYDYPNPWDWSPAAINRRVGYYLEQKYKALGRFIVKTAIVVSVGYVVVGYLKSGSGGGRGGNANNYNNNNNNSAAAPTSRYARHVARMNAQGNTNTNVGNNNNNTHNDGPTLLGSLLSMNPKAVFDYALAPSR